MPIYRCENGKYRIGDGECVFTSRASAERAYVAYLADEEDNHDEEYHKAADPKKISFDFDDTLTQRKWQLKAMQLKEEGYTVYIVTRRQERDSEEVYKIADEVGIPRSRVYFTNGKMKWDTIKRLGIGKHYDNNEDEIMLINDCTDARGELINENKKSMIYNYKHQSIDIKDVDAKQGIVTGYFSAFGNVDSDGDIMMPGAFKRSIQDWGPEAKGRVKHLMNHDPSKPLGKIMELKEDNYGLYYRSKIGTHKLGQDFIKMVESDLIKEHSIGFRILREQKNAEANEIHEVMLFEGSSLTAWGANEATPIVNMKSINEITEYKNTIRNFEKFIRDSDVTDETIELCLIKVRQLAQAVEKMSTTMVTEKEPEQGKEIKVPVDSFINIIKNI
jgi:HK97 family phage prohead protease